MSAKETKKTEEPDFDSLEFVRVFTPVHIPKYLIEQLTHLEYTIDEWYRYQEDACKLEENGITKLNPLNLLYVIKDSGYRVVGMFWAEVNLLTQSLLIHIFSMDPAYWYKGKAVKLLESHAKDLLSTLHINKAYWVTKYPKHSERYGFKRSKAVLMEYEVNADG